MKRQLIFTLTALIAGALLQWYLNLPPPWHFPVPRWRMALMPVEGALKGVLPGAVAGFIAGRHGLLLGAIVGFLGHLAVMVPMYMEVEAASSMFVVLSHAALASSGFAVVAAAGGGTGQLLRSNFGPRGS